MTVTKTPSSVGAGFGRKPKVSGTMISDILFASYPLALRGRLPMNGKLLGHR